MAARDEEVGFQRARSEKIEIDSITIDIPKASAKDSSFESDAYGGKKVSPSKKDSARSAHWSTTPDGALLARATNTVYKKLISPSTEGGLKEFFENNCHKFVGLADGEFVLEHMDLYQMYEKSLERILDDFAQTEKISYADLISKLSSITQEFAGAERYFSLMLSAADFKKFTALMISKAKEAAAKEITNNEVPESAKK
jgi:hypothetical protein